MNTFRTIFALAREVIALSLSVLGTLVLWFVAYGVTCHVLNSLPPGGIEGWTPTLDGLFGRQAADAICFYGTTMNVGFFAIILSLVVEGRSRFVRRRDPVQGQTGR
jgi:hypothetical protein